MLGIIKAAAAAVKDALSEVPVEVKDGEEFYKAAYEAQKPYHKVWYSNIAYFMGRHWLDWNANASWFQQTAAPSWRVRLTANLIMSNVRTSIARMLRGNLRFFGMPTNSTEESQKSSRIASRLFEARYQEDDMANSLEDLALWAYICGSAYLLPLWDSSQGKQFSEEEKDPAGAPVLDEAGKPVVKQYAEGDVVFEVEGGFGVLLQPNPPQRFDEHRKLMRVKFMDVAEIEERWGKKVAPENFSSEVVFQARMMAFIDATGSIQVDAEVKNCALVKEMFEVPCRKYPNGRHWIYANGVVLLPTEDLDYFYRGRRAIPASKVDVIKVPGRCQAESYIPQIAPLNVQFNKLNSQIVQNANLVGNPKAKTPVGSLQDDAWTDEPGELLEYTPGPNGQGPEYLTPPNVPEYLFKIKNELPALIEEITSQHEVSKGRLPRRANSGKAIDLLQTADDTQTDLTARSWASALSRAFSIALDCMKRKYSEERILRRVGYNRQVDIMTFKGSDLAGCDVVRVVVAPGLSRAEKIEVAMELWEKGVVTDSQALEIMETGDLNAIFDRDASQEQYASFENMGMAKGIVYPVGQFEDHPVHLSTHGRFLNSPTGQKLPPEVRAVIEQHMATHEAYVAPALPGAPLPAAAPGPEQPVPQEALP